AERAREADERCKSERDSEDDRDHGSRVCLRGARVVTVNRPIPRSSPYLEETLRLDPDHKRITHLVVLPRVPVRRSSTRSASRLWALLVPQHQHEVRHRLVSLDVRGLDVEPVLAVRMLAALPASRQEEAVEAGLLRMVLPAARCVDPREL